MPLAYPWGIPVEFTKPHTCPLFLCGALMSFLLGCAACVAVCGAPAANPLWSSHCSHGRTSISWTRPSTRCVPTSVPGSRDAHSSRPPLPPQCSHTPQNNAQAVVRYIGSVADRDGLFIGLELLDMSEGLPTAGAHPTPTQCGNATTLHPFSRRNKCCAPWLTSGSWWRGACRD
eukprot:COSAG05_NODE_2700_length_2753_cov_2.522231_3_plen_174_part_00